MFLSGSVSDCIFHSGLLPLFDLPTMRRLRAYGVHFDLRYKPPPNAESSSITHLDLSCCCAVEPMQKMVERCKNLRSFVSNMICDPDHPGSDYESNQDFYGALSGCQHSPEHLSLEWVGSQYDFLGPFGPITNFTALKSLCIDTHEIFDCSIRPVDPPSLPEILPESLEYFHIKCASGALLFKIMTALADHATCISKYTPHLTDIIVEGDFYIFLEALPETEAEDGIRADDTVRAFARCDLDLRFKSDHEPFCDTYPDTDEILDDEPRSNEEVYVISPTCDDADEEDEASCEWY